MRVPPSPGDFEAWRRLAKSDPENFEAMRRLSIEAAIARVPEDRRERLWRLQWRIDQARRTAPNPIAACRTLSAMMWESLAGERGLIDALRCTVDRKPLPIAQVIPLKGGRGSSCPPQDAHV